MKARGKSAIPVIMYADTFQEQEGIRTLQLLISHSQNKEWDIYLFGDRHVCGKICSSMNKEGIRPSIRKTAEGLRWLLHRYPIAISLRPGLETTCDLLPMLDSLWESREKDWSVAAVPLMRDYVMLRYLQRRGFEGQQNYYSTGFMVIRTGNFLKNLDELEKCCKKYRDIYSLEDCVNLVYREHFKALDLSWNYPIAPQRADARNRFLILSDMQRYQACSRQWITDQTGYHSPLPGREPFQSAHRRRKYLFSIITVVFEDSEYVDGWIENILNQTRNFRQMVQMILIDGSDRDDTVKISEEYKRRYPSNIFCLKQESKNVLKARNASIQLARGEILFFMDVHDRLSGGSLESVGGLMEQCPRMQIACIPVRHKDRDNKCMLPVSVPGWVDLDCDYGLRFDGVSGVFFRRTETMEGFDEALPLWEAEWRYLVGKLRGCRRVGYVPEVQLQSKENITCPKDMVYLQKFVDFWAGELDSWMAEHKSIPYWVQFSFMQTLAGCLENAESGWDTVLLWDAMSVPLGRIEDSVVIDALGMQDMSRILHVLEHKYHKRASVTPVSGDLQLICGETIVGMLSYQSVLLHFITVQEGTLTLEGETALPTAVGQKHIHIGLDINGRLHEGEFTGRTADKALLGCAYEYNRAFRFTHKLSCSEMRIRFFTRIGDQRVYYSGITCLRFAPISNEIPEGYAVRENRILKIRGDSLFCVQADKDAIDGQEHRYRRVLKNMGTPEACRALHLRRHYGYFQTHKHRQIWLFFDRIDKADDNGEALFRYVISRNNPDIDAYYVIDRRAMDYERMRSVGRVVAANSVSHQLLHLLADYIFTSQANGFVENPFGKGERFYRDLYHRPKVVFLQHGITKDDQTRQFNRFNQNFHAMITSSTAETNSIKTYPYYYEDTAIWQTGMPRFDRLYHGERRYLLIMPTWRRQLMKQRWDPQLQVFRWRAEKGFRDSLYCRRYSSLLSHRGLRAYCGRYGYQIVFMPHPLVQPYVDQFDIPEDVLVMPYDTSWRDLFAWCDLMITDYSSVAFDMVYLEKPLIYYQFDREEFFAGHTYAEGYFDYETDGFGEIVTEEEELVGLVEDYMAKECSLKEKYIERIHRFYDNLDQKCCERIYQRVFGQQNTADSGYGNVGKQ